MKILVVSNMYPNKNHPSYGIFVKKFVDEITKLNIKFDLSVMFQQDLKLFKFINYIAFYIKTFLKIMTNDYDIIYVHYASHSSIPVILSSKIKKIKVFTNVHGSDVMPETSGQKKMHKYTERIIEISERIIVPSLYFKDVIEGKYKHNAEIYVYPSGGIDANVFYRYDNNRIKAIKQRFNINNEKPIIGMACRISQGKGWDVFVDAINLLGQDKDKANFILVGSGPCDRDLNDQIQKKCLQDVIIRYKLLPQHELADFYNILSYCCSSSILCESLGLVIIEAMACGKPVITSDFAAPKYYVIDGVNGYKFKVGDSKAMSKAILRAINDYYTDTYGQLCNNAYTTAKEYLDTNQISKLKEILTV